MSLLVEYPDGLKTLPLISFYELVFSGGVQRCLVIRQDETALASLIPQGFIGVMSLMSLRVDGVCVRDCLYVAWSLLAFEVLKS